MDGSFMKCNISPEDLEYFEWEPEDYESVFTEQKLELEYQALTTNKTIEDTIDKLHISESEVITEKTKVEKLIQSLMVATGLSKEHILKQLKKDVVSDKDKIIGEYEILHKKMDYLQKVLHKKVEQNQVLKYYIDKFRTEVKLNEMLSNKNKILSHKLNDINGKLNDINGILLKKNKIISQIAKGKSKTIERLLNKNNKFDIWKEKDLGLKNLFKNKKL